MMIKKITSVLDNDAGWYKAGVFCGDLAILAIGCFYGFLCGTALGTALTILFETQSSFMIYLSWAVCGILGVIVATVPAYIFHQAMMKLDDFICFVSSKLRF